MHTILPSALMFRSSFLYNILDYPEVAIKITHMDPEVASGAPHTPTSPSTSLPWGDHAGKAGRAPYWRRRPGQSTAPCQLCVAGALGRGAGEVTGSGQRVTAC